MQPSISPTGGLAIRNTVVWTDGFRLEDGQVGCAIAWLAPADPNPEPSWTGRNTGLIYRPLPQLEPFWSGGSHHLGTNREGGLRRRGFTRSTEPFTFFRPTLGGWPGQAYTIFADAQAATGGRHGGQPSTSLRGSYAPREKTGFRPALKKERKALACPVSPTPCRSREHGAGISGRRGSDECWFLPLGQTRGHHALSSVIGGRLPQIRALWRSVETELGWEHGGWRRRSVCGAVPGHPAYLAVSAGC
ncbi:hypothetical protein FN846DRAFT_940997 [Sphaerosporella brunnea]|uniref:Uncharacterized protein n=1 Tax=Sphaerosporella brunnea TaxID=1250544 RepID=A0A5J5F279_9PEZI|nr:hypothetical protein FN846DRAFT_940997 [Sphaerosporella brunnea]